VTLPPVWDYGWADDPEIAASLEEQGHTRAEPHYHLDERGLLVRCYHNGRALLTNWQFWAGMTLGFPLEHFLWENVWPFKLITDLLGL
jgi:hypothetical protein